MLRGFLALRSNRNEPQRTAGCSQQREQSEQKIQRQGTSYWVQRTRCGPRGTTWAARSDDELGLRKLDTPEGQGQGEGRGWVACPRAQERPEVQGGRAFLVRWSPGPRRTQGMEGKGYIQKLHRGPLAPKTKITELGVREGSRKENLPLCIAGAQSSWPTCKGSVQVGGMGLRPWT